MTETVYDCSTEKTTTRPDPYKELPDAQKPAVRDLQAELDALNAKNGLTPKFK